MSRSLNVTVRALEGMLPDPVMSGFENIARHWDSKCQRFMAKILPGEYYVTKADEAIVTVLGSCISACIRDPIAGVGGMNHFMLPESNSSDASAISKSVFCDADRYGNFAMEHLVNGILKSGGKRENLEIKIFGGGKMLAHMTDIGQRNIAFIKNYLDVEGFCVAAEDLGDIYPRKVIYMPRSGMVRLKRLRSMHGKAIASRESAYLSKLRREPISGEIELF